MIFEPITFIDKKGRTVLLRSAKSSDAEINIEYLKVTTGETRYLSKEPSEITLTLEDERNFLSQKAEAPRELMLLAFVNGEHAGNASFSAVGRGLRVAHRCEIGIALYQRYCGCGIGRRMLETVLRAAKDAGYEQAELRVVADNLRAIALYQSCGFEKVGVCPHEMKYPDGSYADGYVMVKKF